MPGFRHLLPGGWRRMRRFHGKIGVLHDKLAIFPERMAILRDKMAIFLERIIILSGKMAVLRCKMAVLINQMPVVRWRMADWTKRSFIFSPATLVGDCPLASADRFFTIFPASGCSRSERR